MKVVMTGPVAGLGVVGLGREHDEARRVVHLVLDVAREDVEAVDLGGERGRDGGERRVLRLRRTMRAEPAVSASGTGFRPSSMQLAAALAQRLRVAEDALDGLERGAGRAISWWRTRRKCSPTM